MSVFYSQLKVDLDCETAVVLGHGNVALDVARVLLMPVDILAVSVSPCAHDLVCVFTHVCGHAGFFLFRES